VKTTVLASSVAGDEKRLDVTFTVATSPDVTQANFFGHMLSHIANLRRPLLFAESIGSTRIISEEYNNEQWAVITQAVPIEYCVTPEIEELENNIAQMRNSGWPLPGAGHRPLHLWSGTRESIAPGITGIFVLPTNGHQRQLIPDNEDSPGLIICK